MNKIKQLLGFGTIGGLDDLVIRAIKVAVSTFFGLAGADVLGWIHADPLSLRTAIIAGAAAGANVIINAIVKWASS